MIYLLILFLSVLVSYRSWHAPICLHDDVGSILHQASSGYANWNWLGRGRPLYRLINQIQRDIWGLKPLSWHVLNTILHGVNGICIYGLLQTLKMPGLFFLSLAFVVHPIQTASVNYTAGRSGILATFFLICATRFYLLPGIVAYASVIAFWLAVQSREDSLMFVLWLPFLMRFR